MTETTSTAISEVEKHRARAWKVIESAVKAGLDVGRATDGRDLLERCVPVVAGTEAECIATAETPAPAPKGVVPPLRIVTFSLTPSYFDVRSDMELIGGALQRPDVKAITEWATFARQLEVRHVLTTISLQAAAVDHSAAVVETCHLHGFGNRRYVSFLEVDPVARALGEAKWGGEIELVGSFGVAPPVANTSAVGLVLRVGGGPQVTRIQPLALGWDVVDGGIVLRLRGRLAVTSVDGVARVGNAPPPTPKRGKT